MEIRVEVEAIYGFVQRGQLSSIHLCGYNAEGQFSTDHAGEPRKVNVMGPIIAHDIA